jgi:excisionase family DNA binding protein
VNTSLLTALAAEWREEAAVLRRRHAGIQAEVLEGVAGDLEDRLREWVSQELSIAEAAHESGYSEDHLRELVRNGRLPDHRPSGSEGRIHIRRCDLPRKPRDPGSTSDVVHEMALVLTR